MNKIFYSIFDFFVLLSALIFSIAGKDLAKQIFQDVGFVYSGFTSVTFLDLFVVFVASVLFMLVNFLPFGIINRALIYLAIGFSSSTSILITYEPSMMIFFCQILIFSVCTFCFLLREYLTYNMKDEFWKIVFEAQIKVIQISIVVYVAVIAALRFVHDSGDSYLGFSSTIFYPTIIYLFMLFMFGYWSIYPVWIKLFDSYKNEKC